MGFAGGCQKKADSWRQSQAIGRWLDNFLFLWLLCVTDTVNFSLVNQTRLQSCGPNSRTYILVHNFLFATSCFMWPFAKIMRLDNSRQNISTKCVLKKCVVAHISKKCVLLQICSKPTFGDAHSSPRHIGPNWGTTITTPCLMKLKQQKHTMYRHTTYRTEQNTSLPERIFVCRTPFFLQYLIGK